MHKIMFLGIFLFIITGCDQFKDSASEQFSNHQIQEIKPSKTIGVDCSALFEFDKDFVSAQFYNLGRITHNLNSFQIIKAKNCPTLRYQEKIDLKVVVQLKNKKVKCDSVKLENVVSVRCPKI